MKRILLLLLVAMAAVNAFAQDNHYQIKIGDTLVLKPFKQCSNSNYSLSSNKSIRFTPLHYGQKIQVIGLQPGDTQITATCEGSPLVITITVEDPNVQTPAPEVTLAKPETQPFLGTYRFEPPTDHFFITVTGPCDGCRETHAKIGVEEAYSNGSDTDRFWNTQTGANWFYVPSAQGWTEDVKWEFEAFGESFFPLHSFAREVASDDLSQYYTGMEKVLDIDCWTFFVEQSDGNVIRYWVDPSNGCTLRRQRNLDEPYEVTVYNLNFQRWFFGPHFKKSLHDKTR